MCDACLAGLTGGLGLDVAGVVDEAEAEGMGCWGPPRELRRLLNDCRAC